MAKSRSSKVLVDVLGEIYKGILCVDRWGAYTKYHTGLFQICWAHLRRDFLGIRKVGEATQSDDAILFAKTMEELRKKLMAIWYRFKKGEISRAELVKKTLRTRNAMKQCLQDYVVSEKKWGQTLAKNLLKRFNDLFTFIFHEGVEPTNNIAERALRELVVIRKIIGSLRNNKGAKIIETIMTMITTWQQRGLDTFSELKASI